MSNPYAVVVGVDSMQGIQAVRLLTRREIPVIGFTRSKTHPYSSTRLCERMLEADTHGPDVVDELLRLGPTLPGPAVLVPCHDMSVVQIAKSRERLGAFYRIALPETSTIELLMQKVKFYGYAQQHGFPIPPTHLLRNRDDAARAVEAIDYPAVLKPSVVTPAWNAHTVNKALSVGSRDEALETYERVKDWAETLILQQWIPGNERNLYSCNCCFDANGEPVVTFVARKIRQWPPRIGDSSCGEECRNDEVLDITLALFRSTGYRGLGYVEFKRDETTGRHHILDVNVGRPTGRSAIAEAGGVELLMTMYRDALGLPLPPPAQRTQRYGHAKWLDLRHDLQSAFHDWRRGRLTLREWRESLRGPKAHTLLSWRDPVPFLRDLTSIARRAANGS